MAVRNCIVPVYSLQMLSSVEYFILIWLMLNIASALQELEIILEN